MKLCLETDFDDGVKNKIIYSKHELSVWQYGQL